VAFAMVGNLGKIAEAQTNRRDRAKDGNYLYGAFGRDFITKAGRRIMVVALTLRQWRNLLEATQIHEAVGTIEQLMGWTWTRRATASSPAR
jgi:2-methylfumaryl-CoA isomerase